MMADPQMSAVLLNRLRDLGVLLAVDDFGTGYSSLSHLRRFPVTEVKIDRSFVSGIEQDADDEEIVRAIVAMSFAMRMQVVAEGIETRRPARPAAPARRATGSGLAVRTPGRGGGLRVRDGAQPARLKS